MVFIPDPCHGLVDWLIRYPMTAVITVVFTSCPTRGGQQRNQFKLKNRCIIEYNGGKSAVGDLRLII